MPIVMFFIYLFLFYGVSLSIGMSGYNGYPLVRIIKENPQVGVAFAIMLFGVISTAMWDRKARRKENYKMWFYLSTAPILIGLLTLVILNWDSFVKIF